MRFENTGEGLFESLTHFGENVSGPPRNYDGIMVFKSGNLNVPQLEDKLRDGGLCVEKTNVINGKFDVYYRGNVAEARAAVTSDPELARAGKLRMVTPEEQMGLPPKGGRTPV